MKKTWVWSCWEDPLEKGKANHSSILAWRIPERLKAGGEGDDKGWDGWMASRTWRTWVWASSGSWWQTGKPGMLQSMGSQRVRHDWVTDLNWINIFEHIFKYYSKICHLFKIQASLIAQLVKNLPAMQETPVWFLGQEDPLEKEMATLTPVLLPGKIPWMEKPGELQSMGLQRLRHDWVTNTFIPDSIKWIRNDIYTPWAVVRNK